MAWLHVMNSSLVTGRNGFSLAASRLAAAAICRRSHAWLLLVLFTMFHCEWELKGAIANTTATARQVPVSGHFHSSFQLAVHDRAKRTVNHLIGPVGMIE
jgi:hypothetical protein